MMPLNCPVLPGPHWVKMKTLSFSFVSFQVSKQIIPPSEKNEKGNLTERL